MRKTAALLTLPLAFVTCLGLASATSAAPGNTPARACVQVVDLRTAPGVNMDVINQMARALGLAEAPTVVGGACNHGIRTDANSPATSYPGRGPVVLRTSEYAPRQQYCTDSVSMEGSAQIPGTDMRPVPGLIVFGSGCTDEFNPLLV
ncbi:hypothetical protein [Streptomyces yaizuensis]|uniref:Uncharacterized protein n=1 Tax=Streptomyces yaizuensis TaxID=2989713 RepID=A0AA86IVG4_9ACTN|nr:hypothetical protein [Streptomyces sp. YSPA8]BDT39569.1 hypothetical protein SYYSPA8_37255 [Streptomyces sp. YSPA8]